MRVRKTSPPLRDHPRSRGENRGSRNRRGRRKGSSPLTRGKRRDAEVRGHVEGIIPAHAGKTQTGAAVRSTRRDHPRSRGENKQLQHGAVIALGSSPLTRGKRLPAGRPPHGRGIIPAHAGKTPSAWSPCSRRRDHPRSRGENTVCVPLGAFCGGSSPLTRGKRLSRDLGDHGRGIIPAHAGKTCRLTVWPPARRDHPRSRGENFGVSIATITARGSSPLTRGKHRLVRAALLGDGIIPAHAGKTRHMPIIFPMTRDHPRSRGENSPDGSERRVYKGSSPLTRGKHKRIPVPICVFGIIPAHAGKTIFLTR